MALQSSGAISINDINVELGKAGTTTSSLGQSDFRTLAGVASGAISMSNFYGKSSFAYLQASGGNLSVSGDYRIHTFTTSGTFTLTTPGQGTGATIEYMVIAGGGGGGSNHGGGGGAGGIVTGTLSPTSGNSYTITVGGAGAGATTQTVAAGNGGNSSAFGMTAIGGGGGGNRRDATDGPFSGKNGGSGGGGGGAASAYTTHRAAGAGTVGQGSNGGIGTDLFGGGGGGYSGVGANGSSGSAAGGAGLVSSFTGTSVEYSKGGSGGYQSAGTAQTGSYGSGGAGGGGSNAAGSAGKGGAVLIRYLNNPADWILQSGTYASNTFVTNRGGFTPGPVYTSPTFTAVRPKTINMNIRMTQFDWDATISWTLEVYYISSGWVTVGSGSKSQAAGTAWTFTTDVACTIEERATQYRFTSNCRSNNDTQTIKFTEWYI